MKSLSKRLAAASTLAALVLVGATAGGAPAAQKSAVIPNCVPATNIESILDDSGSMSLNDSIKARAQIIQILVELKDNAGKQMAGLEFGSSANELFPLTTLGTPAATASIVGSLGLIQADNGGTNYNAAFALAKTQNPGANARIFLSDGETSGYTNGHLDPRIKTYVVALGSFDPTILNRIVADTGGELFSVGTSAEVLTQAMRLNSRLNCVTDPITRQFQFNRPTGASASSVAVAAKKKKGPKGRKVSFKPDGKTASVLVSHGTTGSVIQARGFKQGKRRVRASASSGANYQLLNLRGLKKGKVRFLVTAKKLAGPTTATVQINP